MVAPYFLPRRRVGSLRPFKFAIHLREHGWQPHILTIASDGQLTDKEQQLLQDIPVYDLQPPFDRTGRSGSQLTQSKSTKTKSFSVGDWIDKHFPVDTWLPFWGIKWNQIKQIAQEIKPDAIWSTGDPWSSHWVGKKLAAFMPGNFWMADFRDPWTLSETDLKKRSNFAAGLDQKIERRWISKASMLSFTTDSTRKLYESHYADLNLNTTTIYNAFDWQLFDTEEEQTVDIKLDTQKLNLMFFGKFRRLSSAKPVIDIVAKLKERYPSAAEKIAVHSFGPLSDSDCGYLETKGVEGCFVIQNPVPAEQGLQVLKKADIMLLSTNPERRDIIPAKFWDYLAAGRPILSIAPNPEIKRILEETGAGIQYQKNQLSELSNLLNKCVLAKEKGEELPISFSVNQDKIEGYSAKSATEKLVTILDHHSG